MQDGKRTHGAEEERCAAQEEVPDRGLLEIKTALGLLQDATLEMDQEGADRFFPVSRDPLWSLPRQARR